MLLTIDFQKEKKRLQQENRDKISKMLNNIQQCSTWGDKINLLDKYQEAHLYTIADKIGVEPQELMDNIICNPLFGQVVFMKEIERTGYQERLQFSVLSTQSKLVLNMINMLVSGKNAIAILYGKVIKPQRGKGTKSIDFIGQTKSGYNIFIAAKYTNGCGGGQDNQALDLECFAKEAPLFGDDNIIVLLADGSYYEKSYSGEENFYSYIQTHYSDKNAFTTDIAYFDIKLKGFLKRLEGDGK